MVYQRTIRHEFHVHGLKCIYCAEQLRDAFNQLPGVNSYVLFKRAYAEVEAPTGVTVERLQAIAGQLGYRLQSLATKTHHDEMNSSATNVPETV